MINERSIDKFIMPFGKYKGEYIADVMSNDPKYIQWIIDNDIDIGDLLEAINRLKDE